MDNDRTKFVVFKANIMDDDGNKVLAGEIVALSPKLARHYNKLGYLRPYMDDEIIEEPEEEESDDEPPLPVGSRRTAAVSAGSSILPGAATKP